MADTSTRSHWHEPRYALAGVVLLAVLVSVVALSFSAFAGRFERTKELVVVSDRAGLVMDPGAKVKMHGVTIGKVAAVDTDGRLARITLAIEPSQFGQIPADASAQIKATTAFGAKYVALQAADFGGPKATNGQTIKALNVTTEVNTLFQSLVGVMDSVDPAKLNATLNGISQALSERGSKLGQMITEGNAVLSEINPLMPTITDDLRRFTAVADTYGDAADNILTMLSNATVTSRTIVDEQRNLDALLASAIGLGNSGSDLLKATGTKIIDVARLLVPTTGLLFKYSPSFKCVADQASYNLDYGMGRFGGNTTDYSLDLDVALLFGDDSYVYPKHLPKVNAKGGPKGAPGCYSQITATNYPTPYLVTDTGYSEEAATSLRPGTNFFIEYVTGMIVNKAGK